MTRFPPSWASGAALYLLALAPAAAAQNRYPIHPHAGELLFDPAEFHLAPTGALITDPLFNVPDGIWNNGEGFDRSDGPDPADTGAHFAFDDGDDLLPSDVHVHTPSEATSPWIDFDAKAQSGSNQTIRRLVGFLHPNPDFPGDGHDARSAFELFIPKTFHPNAATVVSIAIHGTIAGNTASYSGLPATHFADPVNAGLRARGDAPFGVEDILRPQQVHRLVATGQERAEHNVIAGYITPPISGGHMLMTAQRVLQFRRAIQWIFTAGSDTPGEVDPAWNTPDPNDFTFVVSGGSNGGFVSQSLALHFPSKIHGAAAFLYTPSTRRLISQQEACTFITALQGLDGSTQAWSIKYVLPYFYYFQKLGYEFATGDALRMWRDGQVQRPIFFAVGDEDTVGFGEDTFPLIAGTSNYFPSGSVSSTSVYGSVGSLHWSILDATCHEAFARIELPEDLLSNNPGYPSTVIEHWEAVYPVLNDAITSREDFPPETVVDLARPASPAPTSTGGAIDSEADPWDHVLARDTTAARMAAARAHAAHPDNHPGAPGNLLAEVPAFLREQRGLGAWTGMAQSLDTDEAGRIYVGSADGVVSRLRFAAAAAGGYTPANATAVSLAVEARCGGGMGGDPIDGPFSHGYGCFGLDVEGDRLAFGTHRKLWVYDTADLTTPLATADLPWEEQRPRKLQIVDNMFGEGGTFVVSLSFSGELTVREIIGATLVQRAGISLPSARDFLVGPTQLSWSREVYVSGLRNHLFRFDIDEQPSLAHASPARIVGASKQIGVLKDLTWSTSALGAPGVVGLVDEPLDGEPPGLRWFKSASPGALTVTRTAPLAMAGQGSGYATTVDNVNNPGQVVPLWDLDMHAVVHRGRLHVLPGDSANTVLLGWTPDGGTEPPLQSTLYQTFRFPALLYAHAVATTDVDQDGTDDLVIATQNGQVAWLPGNSVLAELQTVFTGPGGGGALTNIEAPILGEEWFGNASTVVIDGAPIVVPPATPDSFSSGSVVATWGMTFGPGGPGGPIEVVDQCGRRWSSDPTTGVPHFVHLVQTIDPTGLRVLPQIKPFRDLAWIGSDALPGLDVANVHTIRQWSTLPIPPAVTPFGSIDHFKLDTWFDIAVAPDTEFPSASDTDAAHVGYFRSIHSQVYADGYLPFAFGGDAIVAGTRRDAYYWTGNPPTQGPQNQNAIRGLRHDIATSDFAVWGTTSNGSEHDPFSGTMPPAGSPGEQLHLRNTSSGFALLDAQSLRTGVWPNGDRIVAGTVGGGIQVLDPGTMSAPTAPGAALPNPQSQSSGDKGFGGLALCVANVGATDGQSQPTPTVFFAPLSAHAGTPDASPATYDMVSTLHVYEVAGDPPVLNEGAVVTFDGTGTHPKLYGVCGIATGDMDSSDADGIADELVLTTLNGDLVVYNLLPSGAPGGVMLDARPLHWSVHDGALGASNAVLVDDVSAERAVFVAGSMGMRKFVLAGP